MRIMYILHSLYVGGAETIATNYLIELKKRGFDVALIEVWHSESFLYSRLMEHGIDVEIIFDGKKDLLSKFKRKLCQKDTLQKRIKTLVETFKPDIIHNHSNMIYLKKIDFPMNRVFLTFHSDLFRYLSGLSSEESQFLKSCVDEGLNLIAISSNILADVKKEYPTGRVLLIPNGVYIDDIKGKTYSREDIERRFGIGKNSFLVGHIGRFNKVKNHERLIEIFKVIHDKRSNSCLLLVGGGTDREIGALKKKANEMGLQSAIVFAGVCSDSAAIASAFDVMIVPSLAESFSLVMVEAQAHHVRCIGSSVIPKEVFCNRNCISLPLEMGNDVWAEYALDTVEKEESSDIRRFDIAAVIDQHIAIYAKANEIALP